MNKSIVAAAVVVLVLAVVVLAACSPKVDSQVAAVVEQKARQEGARADELQARADEAKARAAAAWSWSGSSSILAAEWGRRWPVVVVLVLAVGALVAAGSSVAWVRWAWGRASVVSIPGGLVAIFQRSAVVVVDPARMIGGVLQLDAGGVLPVLQTSEELAADVARAALVARAVERVGGNESRVEIAARVTESLSSAFTTLAGAAAAPAAMAAAAPALRLVRVRSAAEKKKAALIDDTAELREFVEVGAVRGFQRREWAGYKFKSTGRACSQTRWATLAGWLREAELLDGSGLVGSASEALQRLGYDAGDDAVERAGEHGPE